MSELRKYISDNLGLTKSQKQFFKGRIRAFQNLFQHNTKLKLKQCLPGGSFEKGTMLRYNFELDIVMVLEKPDFSFEQVQAEVCRVVKKNMPELRVKEIGKVSIPLSGKAGDQVYHMDIVPTFLINSPLQAAQVKNYASYQGATSIWHIKYVRKQKARCGDYVNLVLYIKNWVKANKLALKSFHVELIVAFAVERRGILATHPLRDNLIECFKVIMSLVDGSPVFPVNWEYFNKDKDLAYFKKDSVVLIDPANPKDNLAKGISKVDWKIIRSMAHKQISKLQAQGSQ